ncbi:MULTISPECIES: thiamine pyrophosphate-binding protein [unclassified Achromobacter]|uniref:thiamine pyrophosphate-binding protein n=1 Tax=unclassified Achromobacter TaxID=2626865 RepID=UPI000B519311|nr:MULTISPECIES: thiamine pyrophosphate-dependent enzyme [unclassified Achromobacter]OWT77612.1 acetolactate synthase [Achromobacter sp. HZ28]OWT78660.1 acetolactate synthase [Achromobacter sp. HZ34]
MSALSAPSPLPTVPTEATDAAKVATAVTPLSAPWGSDYLAALLRHIGLEYVALNPGASYRGLHDSLVNYLGDQSPKMLTVLHEEHAVAIAHGYAKVAGRPMGAILHANVGLMHGSMAIFDAYCDRVPVMVFGATGPVDSARRRPWIDWLHTAKDQGALVRTFVKWDAEPSSLEGARDAVLRARQIATTQPQGPVYVCFDSALQEAPCTEAPPLLPLARYAPPRRPGISDHVAREVAQSLYQARRPVILAGRVSRDEADWQRRVAFAEHCGATVLTDFKVGAAFPTRHPLHGTTPSFFMADEGLEKLCEADLVLSLDWVDLAGTLRTAWGAGHPPAHVVQVSLDQVLHNGFGGEHQGLAGTDTYLLCDPDEFVAQTLDALRGLGAARVQPSTQPAASPLPQPAAQLSPQASSPSASSSRSDTPATLPAAAPDDAEGMSLGVFAGTVSERLLRNAPACLIRANLGWPGDAHPLAHPLDYLGYDGGGGIGSGPGMAVGAALALRGTPRLPVAVLGDGDFLMGITALWTAVSYGIPLLVIVANNRSFFNDEVHQEKVAQMRSRPVENKWIGQRIEGPEIDLAGLARAQGALGWGSVRTASELAEALDEAIAAVQAGKVAVIDARVAREYAKTMAKALGRGH